MKLPLWSVRFFSHGIHVLMELFTQAAAALAKWSRRQSFRRAEPQASRAICVHGERALPCTLANDEVTLPMAASQGQPQAVASGPPPTQRTASAMHSQAGSRAIASGSLSPEDAAAQIGVCAIIAKPADFNHITVTLQGTATALKETTSHRGNDYTTFKLQDPSRCGGVNIFAWGHPALNNGDQVRVEGVFETVHRVRQYTFHNEVEATKVTPVPR
jgi:hypothetical protein